jgi:molybdopterin converting factor small subunit
MHGTSPTGLENARYICTTSCRFDECDRNAAKQDELLTHIVDAVVERFTNPDVERQLRESIAKQVKRTSSKANGATIGKQLATVEAKLIKAKRRLLEVDSDMIPVVSEQIRELVTKQEDLTTALKAASVSPKRLMDEAVESRSGNGAVLTTT